MPTVQIQANLRRESTLFLHKPWLKTTTRTVCLYVLAPMLSACGFLTAPVEIAGVGVISSSVRATDYVLSSSKTAAIQGARFTHDTVVAGATVAADTAQQILVFLKNDPAVQNQDNTKNSP